MSFDGDPSHSPPLPPSLEEALRELYTRVEAEVGETGAVCWLRGDCCDFDKTDHVLFATTIEIDFARSNLTAPPATSERDSRLCPFWKHGLCTERERRPLGCRTYFCDRAYQSRLEAIHERYHGELRDLAVAYGVEYLYEPFVPALRRDQGGPRANGSGSGSGSG